MSCHTPPPPSSYRKLGWARHGFEKYDLNVYTTIGDGHCLLHSVMCAIHVSYRTGYKNGVKLSRTVEMRKLRNKMADHLELIDPDKGIPYYYTIGRGALAEFGTISSEFSLKNLQNNLRSSSYLGNEHVVMISYFLKISIYVLDLASQDVYHFGDLPDPTKSAVVTLYIGGHYELVSMGDVTHFAPDHEFINFLRKRLT